MSNVVPLVQPALEPAVAADLQWFKLAEVATLLRCSTKTVRRLHDRGELLIEQTRLGPRVRRSSLQAWNDAAKPLRRDRRSGRL
jgi:excisionase family DNA binding protein